MSTPLPRPEYPRPQFVRADWLNLNGEWEFEIDAGDSGLERGLRERPLAGRITVPFCPESSLSGIGHEDFMNAVWYRRTVRIPQAWAGRQVLLHFQAVDYDTTVWVNGREVVRHRGGFTPFNCELRDVAAPGEEAVIVVRARDDNRRPQPGGKQSAQYGRHSCLYTRTTGIWQTVWLEAVPETQFLRPRITPDVGRGGFDLELPIRAFSGAGLRAGTVRVTLSAAGRTVTVTETAWRGELSARLFLVIPAAHVHLWEPGSPWLYDLQVELLDAAGAVTDAFTSYAGLRSVELDGFAIKINGRPVFQRLVLDQGYYPDGILTAPDDAALIRDIELSMAVGFNGARLHQKVFEERFLYHADRLGYLVWGEFADWGCNGFGPDGDHQQPGATYITQWLEAVMRDYSHPALVGWCGLNETHQRLHDRITVLDDVTRGIFLAAKAMDTTRPVLDTSGYSHRVQETDIWDAHDYEQDPITFRAHYAGLPQGHPYFNPRPDVPAEQAWSQPYNGQPYFVSEFGGIWWNPDAKPGEASWGYGDRPKALDEFYTRFAGLCDVLLDDPRMFGYCYTQLTDVYQEQNGVFTFDRRAKFDAARLHAAQTRRAAIETAG
jgi:beta-galactosidase/beta-glucuronidase